MLCWMENTVGQIQLSKARPNSTGFGTPKSEGKGAVTKFSTEIQLVYKLQAAYWQAVDICHANWSQLLHATRCRLHSGCCTSLSSHTLPATRAVRTATALSGVCPSQLQLAALLVPAGAGVEEGGDSCRRTLPQYCTAMSSALRLVAALGRRTSSGATPRRAARAEGAVTSASRHSFGFLRGPGGAAVFSEETRRGVWEGE